jgi:hypothetical protein
MSVEMNRQGVTNTLRTSVSDYVCVMATLAQIYEEHAKDCLRSAARTDDPKRRDFLLKLAMQWRRDAEALRQRLPQHAAGYAR